MILTINSVNQLIFVMVKCCIFFAVQTGFLNIIQMSFGFKGLILIPGDPINRTRFLLKSDSSYERISRPIRCYRGSAVAQAV
jgi:hypothetical protein